MTHTQAFGIFVLLVGLLTWGIVALLDENTRINNDLREMRQRDALRNALGEPKISTRQGGKL